jgi:hypothetical protein
MKNEFLYYEIQVGKGKGSYKSKYVSRFQSQALLLYRGINVGNGYKKRLVEVYEKDRNIISREFS